jgi:hypothetical protein
MLNFKFQQQNLFDQVSERGIPLYGTIPTNGVIFADSDITSKGGSLINMGNRLIKISAPANAGSTVNFSPTTTAVSLSSSGAHTSTLTNTSTAANPASIEVATFTTLNATNNDFTSSAGAHTHSISNIWSGSTNADLGRLILGAFDFAGSKFIPSGGIVFGNSQLHPMYSSWGGYSNWLGMATSTSDINTTIYGASSYTTTTAASANHSHGPTATRSVTSGSVNFGSTADTPAGSHSHTVSVSAAWTLNNKVYLWAWKSTDDYIPVVRGTTIGWNSTSTSLPQGWYFCDGGTYNGYTTLNLNQGLHVAVTPGNGPFSYGYSLTTGTDSLLVNNFVDSSSANTTYNAGSHVHSPFTNAASPTLGSPTASAFRWHHGAWSQGWSHVHTPTPTSATYTGGPSSYGLPFIVYLP